MIYSDFKKVKNQIVIQNNINMEKILKWWKENKVRPKVSKVFNLEDTKYALQALINREVIGKAVIKVR